MPQPQDQNLLTMSILPALADPVEQMSKSRTLELKYVQV